jgi:hypothetical protein
MHLKHCYNYSLQTKRLEKEGKHRRDKNMSIVIIGGHDRMVCQYKRLCKDYKCKAKVFTQMSGNLKDLIGSPDLIVLFTNTVSHKMVRCALCEAQKSNAEVVRCHTSSENALEEILKAKCS